MELNVLGFLRLWRNIPAQAGAERWVGGGLNVKRERRLILRVIAVLVSSPAAAPSLRPPLHYSRRFGLIPIRSFN